MRGFLMCLTLQHRRQSYPGTFTIKCQIWSPERCFLCTCSCSGIVVVMFFYYSLFTAVAFLLLFSLSKRHRTISCLYLPLVGFLLIHSHGGNFRECFLDIDTTLGTSVHHLESMFLCKGLCLLFTDLSLVLQIALGAYQQLKSILIGMLLNLLQP